MTIVEAREPDGSLAELSEVNITHSGLYILITDTDGNQVRVHRYAWAGVVREVEKLVFAKSIGVKEGEQRKL